MPTTMTRWFSAALIVTIGGCDGEVEVLDETMTARDVQSVDGENVSDVVEADEPIDATPPVTDVPPSNNWRGPPYPHVLVHGFSGFTDIGPLDYFFGVVARYQELGGEAFAPAQPPYAGVAERAAALRTHVDAIRAATERRKVHLICHSQGGLDCRYLASQLDDDDRIASIITIGTPHFGTPLADIASAAPDGVLNPAGMFLAWMLGFLEGPPSDDVWNNDDTVEADFTVEMTAAVADMTSDGAAAFNAAVPDNDDVPVFSVASVSNLLSADALCADGLVFDPPDTVDAVDALLVGPALLISGLELRRNDGVVPTDSMKWGTFLGCFPADHLDQVGQIADLGPGLVSGFDHIEMYDVLFGITRVLEVDEAP